MNSDVTFLITVLHLKRLEVHEYAVKLDIKDIPQYAHVYYAEEEAQRFWVNALKQYIMLTVTDFIKVVRVQRITNLIDLRGEL